MSEDRKHPEEGFTSEDDCDAAADTFVNAALALVTAAEAEQNP